MIWQTMKTAPRKPETIFLVRPAAINPATGKKYIPTIVHKVGTEICQVNSTRPIDFGSEKLEWHEIPD